MKTRLLDTISHLKDASMRNAADAFLATPVCAQILNNSPFLTQILQQQAEFLGFIAHNGIETAKTTLTTRMDFAATRFTHVDELIAHLRAVKAQVALLTAIADLQGTWTLEDVTRFLSDFAENALKRAIDFLLLDARKRGELLHICPETPSHNSGLVVLGMGKLGGFELNYSSDIDIVILFAPEKQIYNGKQTLQQCYNRIVRDLVKIMHERTADGYVFRTDIRLRPDPSSTPPALSINAAMTYYETVGQNWERAAFIKARAVAGDITAGEAFLKMLTPFIWRRNLDFVAIQDIHSIKRQIDHRTGGAIALAGHNLKLGAGGIREIEFYAQVQQLIWGGRMPELRGRATCDMLHALDIAGIVLHQTAKDLIETYHYLRTLEHRIQMRRDQQTHSLPDQGEELLSVMRFAGFSSLKTFENTTLMHLKRVQNHYAQLFGVEQGLGTQQGILVFTGVEPDPETVRTLERMGFTHAESFCEIIMNWHRGHRRATRFKQAREALTELTPALLKALSETVNPDAAFLKFDEFLGNLPAGVQIFSLFAAKPDLLNLVAMVMGSAPRLAEILSRNPSLLDSVLTGAFYDPLPNKTALANDLARLMHLREGMDDFVDIVAEFKNEKMFQAGIQLIKGIADDTQIGQFLSDLADIVLSTVLFQVKTEFAVTYGIIAHSELSIVGMGKLGARELTSTSDLDLIFIYDSPENTYSNGQKSFSASVYYNRLCQRFLGVLTSLNRKGRLYEVDTRLRPLGRDGPLAASLDAYQQYFTSSAWTFELMALTRARIVDAAPALQTKLEHVICHHLQHPREAEHILEHVQQMRKRIETRFATQNPWNLKYIRGGMIDLDFIAQTLQLQHGKTHLDILSPHTQEAFFHLAKLGFMEKNTMETLCEAYGFFNRLLHILRLCTEGILEETSAPDGLKNLLCQQLGCQNFTELREKLQQIQNAVYAIYQNLMENPS